VDYQLSLNQYEVEKSQEKQKKETGALYRSVFQGQVNGRKSKVPTRANLLGSVRRKVKKLKRESFK
jgi:hypothetical protein